MILILSNNHREASVLTTLCDHRRWACQPCATIDQFIVATERVESRALVVRHRLQEGYSDDVLDFLKTRRLPIPLRVIVLMDADTTSKAEARQLALGADCVLRDPVRLEVLLAYLEKYRTAVINPSNASAPERLSYKVADVEIFPHEQKITRDGKSLHIAPQEVALLRLLARSNGKVVTYPVMYDDLLNRRFAGDTTNCRVLLGKVSASFKKLGVDLKTLVRVIPKSGYLYSAVPNPSPATMSLKKTPSKSRRA